MNFHSCRELPNKYLGSDRKKTILIGNERYLLKFPDPTSGYPLELELSYINNAISEYIGCKIYESIGIPVQGVRLGTYKEPGKEAKVACACKDFCSDGFSLYEAEALLISRTEEIKSNRMELDYIISFIDQMEPIATELKQRFFDMFVVDCWICNADRHNNNWGVLIHEASGEMKPAPVYDCGSSLSPLLADDFLNDEIAKEHALGTHSAIMHHGSRIWSSKYILSCENKDLNEAIVRIVPRIDLHKIFHIIDTLEYAGDVRKSFYRSILQYGYDLVLYPAYENITNKR